MLRYSLPLVMLLFAIPFQVTAQVPERRGLILEEERGTPVLQVNRRVAFLIGIGKFKHDLQNLGESPKKDATVLAEVLKQGGFEVVTLTDEKATREEIIRRYAASLKDESKPDKALKKGDLFVFIACTHGFTLPPQPDKPDAPFLAAHDSKLDKPETMVGLNDLMESARSTGATVLYLLDACRALPAGKGRGQARGIEPTRAELPVGTAILFGCGRGEVSFQSTPDSSAHGHGLLTYAVLKALRGETGLSGDLSWSELVAAVQRSFRTEEFLTLLPGNQKQSPTAATGELAYTNLLRVIGPVEDDYRAFCASGPPSLKPDCDRAKFLSQTAKIRLPIWKERAEKGDATAQLLYGRCFQYGAGVEQNEVQAAFWILKAAESGSPDAMLDMSRRYIVGKWGVKQDKVKGAEWMRKAADAGNLVACWRLGGLYQNGVGVKQSDQEAVEWYRVAAIAGNAEGMIRLAKMFEAGKGVKKMPGRAFFLVQEIG